MNYVLLCPWKIANKSIFSTAQKFFEERISQHAKLDIHSPKSDFESPAEQNTFLVREVQKLRDQGYGVFCCDENGETFSSEAFSKLLEKKERQFPKGLVICLGGAYGLPEELKSLIEKPLLSFSNMTFSHELASVIAMEQLYRQILIRKGHPYHHGDVSKLAHKMSFEK